MKTTAEERILEFEYLSIFSRCRTNQHISSFDIPAPICSASVQAMQNKSLFWIL
jgi:hypothetical protein